MESRQPPRSGPAGAALPRADVTAAIHLALVEELAEHGYGRTSVEAVARRAGVGKAAIYRRWPSKLDLVIGVISTFGVRPQDVADLGSLHADLLGFLHAARALLSDPRAQRIVPDLTAEAIRSPQLGAVIDEQISEPRRRLARQVLDRAIARGELREGLDLQLAMDVVPAALYWRLSVRRRTMSDEELERLADSLVAALSAL